MFKHTRTLASLALLGSLSLTACDSGEPGDDGAGEEELISQVTLSLTPDDGGETATIQVNFDADGTNRTFSPSTLVLRPGVTYAGSIELRDTFNDEDITEEIEEEAEEHLFAYALSPASIGTVRITDTESDYSSEDDNSGDFAVGLDFEVDVAAGASGSGTMNAILYHFDDAPKTSSTATSDEIDVEVPFPVTVGAGS
ncbi:hypothetical protein [Rubrivirga sp.]|uniref:hypothetical protein n=1 Tax=Rubrivirga sp. TaxID=1885344 RepID=UPI003C75101F